MTTDSSGRGHAPSAVQGAGLTLAILAAVYGVNYVDRAIVGLLLQPIKRDLALSDGLLGILTGLAFAVFYTTLAIPIARLAERGRPKTIVAICLATFSAATALGSLATTYWQLLLARVFVGIGEAGTTPASLALISRIYPADKRPGAMAVFSLGAQLGAPIGFVLATFIAARYGWRAGMFAAGLPGLLLAVLVVRWVIEPPAERVADQRPTLAVLGDLGRNRSFVLLCLAGGASLFAMNASGAWLPSYLQRGLGLEVQQVGLLLGGTAGLLGATTTWLSGRLADRVYRRGRGFPLVMAACVMLIYGALLLTALWSPDKILAIAILLVGLALGLVWQGPLLAQIQSLARDDERPTATALYIFIANIIGMGLGPTTVGFLSDSLGSGAQGLRTAISFALLATPVSAILLVAAARSLPRVAGESAKG